jgi:siroheme synthase-like protein
MNTLFPIFLKADQLHFLIIGGGKVGLEKYNAIRNQSVKAKISVVAFHFIPEFLTRLQTDENAIYTLDFAKEKHFTGVDIVISALANKDCTAYMRSVAKNLGLLFNAADQPAYCDFYLGSIVRKGDLKFAISTNGKSPTMAKRWREILDELVPDNSQQTLENLEKIRSQLTSDFEEKIKVLNELTANFVVPKKSENT